jgi:hypothetical protein
MDTERVPTLGWPNNLFRDAADWERCEELANPFLEASDFASAPEPHPLATPVPCHEYAMAA